MTCAKDRLNLRWGSDDPWRTSSFGGVVKYQYVQTSSPRARWSCLHLFWTLWKQYQEENTVTLSDLLQIT